MPPAAIKLELRVTVLERELRKMRSELKAVRKLSKQPWWKRLAGKTIHSSTKRSRLAKRTAVR